MIAKLEIIDIVMIALGNNILGIIDTNRSAYLKFFFFFAKNMLDGSIIAFYIIVNCS